MLLFNCSCLFGLHLSEFENIDCRTCYVDGTKSKNGIDFAKIFIQVQDLCHRNLLLISPHLYLFSDIISFSEENAAVQGHLVEENKELILVSVVSSKNEFMTSYKGWIPVVIDPMVHIWLVNGVVIQDLDSHKELNEIYEPFLSFVIPLSIMVS